MFDGKRTLVCPLKGTNVFRSVCIKKCEYSDAWCKFSPRPEPEPPGEDACEED